MLYFTSFIIEKKNLLLFLLNKFFSFSIECQLSMHSKPCSQAFRRIFRLQFEICAEFRTAGDECAKAWVQEQNSAAMPIPSITYLHA